MNGGWVIEAFKIEENLFLDGIQIFILVCSNSSKNLDYNLKIWAVIVTLTQKHLIIPI